MIDIQEEVLSILKKYNIQNEETLLNTPKRVSKAISELWQGLDCANMPKLAFFEATKGQIILIENIVFNSTCEHHLMPFNGFCNIEFKSSGFTLGLSKFNRLVQHFAYKPTIQENLTSEIYNYLFTHIRPVWLKVEVCGKHSCVSSRGVKDPCSDTKTVMDTRELY